MSSKTVMKRIFLYFGLNSCGAKKKPLLTKTARGKQLHGPCIITISTGSPNFQVMKANSAQLVTGDLMKEDGKIARREVFDKVL